ncbi:aquaporin [Heliocybe sulcata]|uniref:Aquaporin n=1 Tax=Heliocybe sulcata TaxID=5364 RepID=A0A5C3MQY9_9AGAM|nr:aquaporin [Heliocybe sulcata]
MKSMPPRPTSPQATQSSSGVSLRRLFTPPESHHSNDSRSHHIGRTNSQVSAGTSTNAPSERRKQRRRFRQKSSGSVDHGQTADRHGSFWVGGQPGGARREQNSVWGVGGVFPERREPVPIPEDATPPVEDHAYVSRPTGFVGYPTRPVGPMRMRHLPPPLPPGDDWSGLRSPRANEPSNPLDTASVSLGGPRRNSMPGPLPDLKALQSKNSVHHTRRGAQSPPPSSGSTVYDQQSDHDYEDDRRRGGDGDHEEHEHEGQVGGPMPETGPERRGNYWIYLRWRLREPFAEWLGIMIMILIGIGSSCQTKISDGTYGNYTNLMFAWGYAVTLAIYISGGVSGGHLNPTITICLALFRGFPWRMVPRYILAQIFGAFCGAAILYGNYKVALEDFDPEMKLYGTNASAPLFITMPSEEVGGARQGCLQEVIASAILHVVVLALGDEHNAPPGAGLGAFITGLTIIAIGMSQGWISGYAINPARDLGPRIFLWFMGYGTLVWHHDSWWWLNGAILSTIAGGVLGCLLYDIFIFGGDSSFINFPTSRLREATGVTKLHRMVRAGVSKSNQEDAEKGRTGSEDMAKEWRDSRRASEESHRSSQIPA